MPPMRNGFTISTGQSSHQAERKEIGRQMFPKRMHNNSMCYERKGEKKKENKMKINKVAQILETEISNTTIQKKFKSLFVLLKFHAQNI